MTEDDKVSPESEGSPKSAAFKGKEKRERSRPLTKIVCRRLPPNMNEEDFLEQVSPIPEHDYFYFSKPDPSLTPDLFSRAYINFVNVDDIFLFRDKFDDYIFLDEKGNEFPAIVEYAPFQRLPKKRRKKDPKSGTMETDSTYLEFLESLKETDSDSREPKMEYSYQPTEEKKETSTPLLEFLAARRRDERRRREDRQRRRPRNRKEDEIPEEDEKVKKIIPRDIEKEKPLSKKKDDIPVSIKSESSNVEPRESKYVKPGSKGYREVRKPDDQRKKPDYEKKDYSKGRDVEISGADEKGSRRERKDRQREQPRDKIREVKKYSDSRRDKVKLNERRPEKLPSFRKMEEAEQDDLITSPESKAPSKSSVITSTSEIASEKPKISAKGSLISSNIKPFTQLPQYNAEDLSKVIEELDKTVNKMKIEENNLDATISTEDLSSVAEVLTTESKKEKISALIITKPKEESTIREKLISKETTKSEKYPKKVETFKSLDESVVDNLSPENEANDPMQRRSSLESSEKKSPSEETNPLRRHKSLDDKSQDTNDEETKPSSRRHKANDTRPERRIRNKDRPSIAIYQPGMGRIGKSRLDRDKDAPVGTYKSIDPNIGKLPEEED